MAAHTLDNFPSEISEKFAEFRESLKAVDTVLEPVFSTTVSEMRGKFEPLDCARFDLVSAYALNSLFFMYLRTKGEDAQEHDIKKELERIRGYMSRLKDTVERQKAMRVNVPAVKRFVSNALWTPKDKVEEGKPQQVQIAAKLTIQESETKRKRLKKS